MPSHTNDRRTFLRVLGAGTVLTVLGGLYVVVDDSATRAARKLKLPDGRPRLPPGQSLLSHLRPMGGQEGDASPSAFKLSVHGAVDHPFEIDFAGLLAMPQIEQTCDVHCVTKWSLFDSHWTGVRVVRSRRARGRQTQRAPRRLRSRARLHREHPAPRSAPPRRARRSHIRRQPHPSPARRARSRARARARISGRARSGSRESSFAKSTNPAIGRRADTTTTPTRGRKSVIPDKLAIPPRVRGVDTGDSSRSRIRRSRSHVRLCDLGFGGESHRRLGRELHQRDTPLRCPDFSRANG